MAAAGLAECLDALLPQTQCTRCGYPACRPYADAIAAGTADIDQCPPGGQHGVDALAAVLGIASKPLNAAFGIESRPAVVVIDEDVCIGCTKCIDACPVDAIVGSGKRMHSVLADECTGCELCIPPCPVDCIAIVPIAAVPMSRDDVLVRAEKARQRYETREQRRHGTDGDAALKTIATPVATASISRNAVLDAIARGRARRGAS